MSRSITREKTTKWTSVAKSLERFCRYVPGKGCQSSQDPLEVLTHHNRAYLRGVRPTETCTTSHFQISIFSDSFVILATRNVLWILSEILEIIFFIKFLNQIVSLDFHTFEKLIKGYYEKDAGNINKLIVQVFQWCLLLHFIWT